MKATRTAIAAIVAALLAMSAAAAPRQAAGFAKPPAAALKALKATVGKPFTSGYVFVDGKYMKPPYKVERWGTVIRVNGVQVTNEIVPWEEFIKTQEGVVAKKTVSTPQATDTTPAPAPVAEVEEEEDDEDIASSLDDLFDDEPAKKKPAKKKKKSSVSYKPRPKKPTTTVTYSFDGEFVPNEKTKALLARINTTRDRIDAKLRAGGIICASAKYSYVGVDGGPVAEQAMEKLPALLKAANSPDELFASVRNAGMVFFSQPLCVDLYRNRFTYLRLQERVKTIKEKQKWQSLGL